MGGGAGRKQSMGSQRVGHDWTISLHLGHKGGAHMNRIGAFIRYSVCLLVPSAIWGYNE